MKKILTFGEIMLRLSTLENMRLEESSRFAAHYGGGEANVAVSLANFGHQAAFASKVPDNALGHAAKKHLARYGVDTTNLLFGGERLGTYYLEQGTGLRASSVIYDRKHSSLADMQELEWDQAELFRGVALLHISGITPALSSKWSALMVQLVREAKIFGVRISLDINYRGKLWSVEACGAFVREIAPYVDYCSAAKLDALNFFNITEKTHADLSYYYQEITKNYPNIQVFYSTERQVFSAQHNHLQGNLYYAGKLYQSKKYDITQIVDRVGGGDAFAAGILHGLIKQTNPQKTVDFAAAAATLKHTIPGDCNPFTVEEVEEFLIAGGEIKR